MLSSPKVTLAKLRDPNGFLASFPDNQKSAAFEYLVSKSFAYTLALPFFTSSDDDPGKSRKVVWKGSLTPMSKAPPGPDCLIHGYGFNCVIEPTRREGATQWTSEGTPLVRHTTDAIAQFHWRQPSVYSILAATRIARDTFYNFHTNPCGLKIVLLEPEQLFSILETSILAISMQFMEFVGLMEEIREHLRVCGNLNSYRNCIARSVSTWKLRVLESEKHVFIGLKALKTIKNLKKHPPIGIGELYGEMSHNNWIKHYLSLLDQILTEEIITESLTRQGFACCQAGMYDTLVYPVMIEELINRVNRIHEQVRMVGFQ